MLTRFRPLAIIVMLVLLAGCGDGTSPAVSTSTEANLVGTWRFGRIEKHTNAEVPAALEGQIKDNAFELKADHTYTHFWEGKPSGEIGKWTLEGSVVALQNDAAGGAKIEYRFDGSVLTRSWTDYSAIYEKK